MNSTCRRSASCLVSLVLLTAVGAAAQVLPDPAVPSVVELSRRAREAQSPKGQSAGWIYTNEGRFRRSAEATRSGASAPAPAAPVARPTPTEPAPEIVPDQAGERETPPDEMDPAGRVWRVSLGEDRTISLSDSETFPINVKLVAVAEHAIPGETQWSQTSGPVPVGLVGSRSSETTVILPAPGTYRLRLSASVGEVTTESEVELVVHSASDGAGILR